MAEIFGTRRADQLFGTDENDLIRCGRNEDYANGGLGDDTLYGGDGNDLIEDYDGVSVIYGGRGSDRLYFSRGEAWGGLGNDQIVGGDLAVGGVGNDNLYGSGQLWGDQVPGQPEQPGGRDVLGMVTDADGVWAHGGAGRDTFQVEANGDSSAVIADFTLGVDKLLAFSNSNDTPDNRFFALDANNDRVLDWQDSLSGGAVYTDGVNLFLGLDATVADPSSTDATCWLTLNNVTSVAAADWLFPDW